MPTRRNMFYNWSGAEVEHDLEIEVLDRSPNNTGDPYWVTVARYSLYPRAIKVMVYPNEVQFVDHETGEILLSIIQSRVVHRVEKRLPEVK